MFDTFKSNYHLKVKIVGTYNSLHQVHSSVYLCSFNIFRYVTIR